ncbi:MAG: dienelactone hydrolase family protein [Acidimicrobiia bacterium]|nr:dienelactone hydrolase family protein [Acidimicrobiia bacterium]
MTVLKGEGKVPILFGTTTLPAGGRQHRGYLARPDLTGQWPTVIVVPDVWGISPSIKDLCRKLARWELAAVSVDHFRGTKPAAVSARDEALRRQAALPAGLDADLDDIVSFVTNRAGFWSSAEFGFGVLGIGTGAAPAARLAGRSPQAAVAVVSAPLQPIAGLLATTSGLLGLFGRDDAEVPVDEVIAARGSLPHAELVLYEGVGADFLDDGQPGYDLEAATDAVERLVAFFIKHLPPTPRGRS